MTCPDSVGKCVVMRTCPCCKRVFGSRGAAGSHQRSCKEPMDTDYATYQHDHWQENHDHFKEKARRRMSGRRK